ncbi:urease accessory protein UreE [Microcoleus sp. FACHB-1515]|uniref:urease accessory protein UreE n=1 Tax=Cyanophyceae TaxID=3028117 RepID=UPI001689002F|nr:urease accessory protein UreE [Microcoleus sp. FACHB-1515]MBD2089031.1 urease accessory protein UreE [Microcoleus sp. FACHB-1515]
MNDSITLTQRFSTGKDFAEAAIVDSLALTAEERTRSRHHFKTASGRSVYFNLPRGTVLQHGDLLSSDDDRLVSIAAKPEPVLTITAHQAIDLLRAAYHLGNRHVPLEVTSTYLRLSPDPVLRTMLDRMGLHVAEEIAPFSPEVGAYGHLHHSSHTHD